MARALEYNSSCTSGSVRESSIKIPRVLFVIPGEAEGASMIFAKRQVEFIQEQGVIGKAFFLESRTAPLVLVREWRRFRKEVERFKPDLVHAHFGTMTAFFCIVATGLPTVVTFQGSDLNPVPSIPWLRSAAGKLLSQVSALRASRIICVSQQLKGRLWWGKDRATVIPPGVDTTLFHPRHRDEVRAELGWGKEERVVLFAGRTPKVKRLDLAQSAVDVAKTICGEIRFVVLDGSVESRVIPLMMNGADCFLLTSDWEGSPTVVQEALACNLPVVSVDVGDVRERLAGVEPSKIVSREPKELGKALAEVLTKCERSNGYEAIQELSLERLAARTLTVYRAALGES